MNKILFVHNSLPDYRVPWFIELSKIAECDFVITNAEIALKTYGGSIKPDLFQEINCKILPAGIRGYIDLIKLLRHIKKYDFVELPPIDSLSEYIKSVLIFLAAKFHSIKVGYFWEKWEAPLNKQPVKRKIKNWILRNVGATLFLKVDVIFSPGIKNREYFTNSGVNPNRIHWIPDVSETSESISQDIRSKLCISNEQRVFLYFGRLTEEKGVDILINALRRLGQTEKWVAIIAGDGPMKETAEQLVKESQLNNVIFVGRIDPAYRADYFSACDAFVFPCTFRNGTVDVWGLTINEAVYHKKFVIATTAVGSSYELVKNGINGFQIEAGNVDALTNVLQYILNNNISKEGIEYDEKIAQTYSYKNMATEYVKIIESVKG